MSPSGVTAPNGSMGNKIANNKGSVSSANSLNVGTTNDIMPCIPTHNLACTRKLKSWLTLCLGLLQSVFSTWLSHWTACSFQITTECLLDTLPAPNCNDWACMCMSVNEDISLWSCHWPTKCANIITALLPAPSNQCQSIPSWNRTIRTTFSLHIFAWWAQEVLLAEDGRSKPVAFRQPSAPLTKPSNWLASHWCKESIKSATFLSSVSGNRSLLRVLLSPLWMKHKKCYAGPALQV